MSTKYAEGITSKPLVQCNARRVLDGYKIRINDSSNRESFLINGRDTVYLLIALRVFTFVSSYRGTLNCQGFLVVGVPFLPIGI